MDYTILTLEDKRNIKLIGTRVKYIQPTLNS